MQDRVLQSLALPVFVKPANLGSSVGISKVKDSEALPEALNLASQYDRRVLVEKGLECREFECSVLGNDEPKASVIGEIVPTREFYDYQAKYSDETSELHIPADIDAALADDLRRMAVTAFQAVDAAGLARVDFFLETESGKPYVNEINTLPGFTTISMYPKLWEAGRAILSPPDRRTRGPRSWNATGTSSVPSPYMPPSLIKRVRDTPAG